jgi:hypothetical protein
MFTSDDTLSLAKTLVNLSRNETLYLSYFKWRDKFEVNTPYHWGCDVCSKLNHFVRSQSSDNAQHTSQTNNTTYDSLFDWWVSKSKCENSPIKWSDVGNIAKDFYHLLFWCLMLVDTFLCLLQWCPIHCLFFCNLNIYGVNVSSLNLSSFLV